MAIGPRATPEALLIDLDGVVRTFDSDHAAAVEREFGLPAGSILDSALARTRLRPVLVGDEPHRFWLDSIVLDLADAAGGADRALAAVEKWHTHRGEVVPEVLALVRELRAAGVPVGLATNATSRLDEDLELLGLVGEFDAVVNSSVVRAHKPTAEFFTAACLAVAKAPSVCLFVDDDDRNVRGARAAGLSAYRWNGPDDLRYLRAAFGLS